jgi:hypothetical protein
MALVHRMQELQVSRRVRTNAILDWNFLSKNEHRTHRPGCEGFPAVMIYGGYGKM